MDLDAATVREMMSHFSGHGHISFDLDPRRKEVIEKLPSLSEEDLASLDQKDSSCPICFTPFLAILASEEMALAMESPATSTEELGVTRLVDTCGHVFCRKDIATWIQKHDSCPTCRQPVIERSRTTSSTDLLLTSVRRPTESVSDEGGLSNDLSDLDQGMDQLRREYARRQERLEESMIRLRSLFDFVESRVMTSAQDEDADARPATRDTEDRRDGFVGMYS